MHSHESAFLLILPLARALIYTRGYSSAGRAPALQAGGHRFESDYLHHPTGDSEISASRFSEDMEAQM